MEQSQFCDTANRIANEGAEGLANGLTNNTTLTELNLCDNRIRFVGVKAIAIAMRSNTTLENLNLRDNWIEDVGARELCDGIKRGRKSFGHLDLSHNFIWAKEKAHLEKELSKMLKKLTV